MDTQQVEFYEMRIAEGAVWLEPVLDALVHEPEPEPEILPLDFYH